MQRWEFTGRTWRVSDLAHPEVTLNDKLNDFGREGWQVAAIETVMTDRGWVRTVIFQRPVDPDEPNFGALPLTPP